MNNEIVCKPTGILIPFASLLKNLYCKKFMFHILINVLTKCFLAAKRTYLSGLVGNRHLYRHPAPALNASLVTVVVILKDADQLLWIFLACLGSLLKIVCHLLPNQRAPGKLSSSKNLARQFMRSNEQ
jgi:hypothetical protein